MGKIKATEREFQSLVISWFNEFIKEGSYPFESASGEATLTTAEKEVAYPDVYIWLNMEARSAFTVCPLKTPKTMLDNQKWLKDAADKARAVDAKYFVTWNMRDAAIWTTPERGELASQIHIYHSILQIGRVDDLIVEPKRILLKKRAKDILDDLSRLKREGLPAGIELEATFFVKHLREVVDQLTPLYSKDLRDKISEEPKFIEQLRDWAVKQAMPFDEETTSRQFAYRLIGKIILYQTLSRHRTGIPKMDLSDLHPRRVWNKLREYFGEARAVDYQAVFEEALPDTVALGEEAGELLKNLVGDLKRYNFLFVPDEVIGRVYEQLIPPEKRHDLGQYFTREDLVDLIDAFCIKGPNDNVLDPTCGSGTFLVRAYERLKIKGRREHSRLLSQLWGIDIAHFPAELATINLIRQNPNDYTNFPRINPSDFFDITPSQEVEFALPKGPKRTIEKLPEFDAAVGNFPYIRQELINRRIRGYKDKLEEVLFDDWFEKYGEFFGANKRPKLSGQADIYAYLFFHTAAFLKEGARMGFVTSNAWLDVEYGYELQKFFLKNFKIIAILESRCEPWFEDPQINTIVTILERCSNKKERDEHLAKFVKVKSPLAQVIHWDMLIEAAERQSGLNEIVAKIESCGKLEFRPYEKKENPFFFDNTYEDGDFRIRAIKQSRFLDELEKTQKTAKWGRYLRGPDVYFEILEKCKDKLVPLRKVADVRRGYTTGINEFFYLGDERMKRWGIEEEFLRPVLKSPDEFRGPLIDTSKLSIKLFACNESMETLRRQGKLGALRYIKWGEKQRTRQGVPWPEVPSVSNRKVGWWAIQDVEPAQIFWPKAYDDIHKQGYAEEPTVADCRLYFIRTSVNAKLLAAILNSSLSWLFLEIIGRVALGAGALDVMVSDAREHMLVADYRQWVPRLKASGVKAFEDLTQRNYKPVFEEVEMTDRKKLDRLVLKALGLEPEKYLKRIYDGLTELVRERLGLAKMRKKVKKARFEKDLDKIREGVIEKVLPDGPKKFPEEFLPVIVKRREFGEISVPAEPLELGEYFMGTQEVINDAGFCYKADSVDEAKFIIYAQRPDEFIVKVPKSELALSKAVKSYEKYLRELRKDLYKEAYNRTFDLRHAETMTRRIFAEFGVRWLG